MTLTDLEQHARAHGRVPLDDVLALYDTLPAVEVDELTGAWAGSGLPTGHPLDGTLEAAGWHGKRFTGPDGAHPLVMADGRGLFAIDPAGLPVGLGLRLPRPALLRATRLARPALRARRTTRPHARVRMVAHRGVVTATMLYDALPISDHFRRVDDATLLGVMDLRGSTPFPFALRREPGPRREADR